MLRRKSFALGHFEFATKRFGGFAVTRPNQVLAGGPPAQELRDTAEA